VPAPGTSTADQSGGRVTSAWTAHGQKPGDTCPGKIQRPNNACPESDLFCFVFFRFWSGFCWGKSIPQMQPTQELTWFFFFFLGSGPSFAEDFFFWGPFRGGRVMNLFDTWTIVHIRFFEFYFAIFQN
jgi:hypothetical protein